MTALQITWFLLIGLLLAVYAVLDGFDLGVGFWSLFARKEEEKSTLAGAIAPHWDGNEVWLLVGGGALFAAFPRVYATVFSGFYLALVLVLFALIFRAVSLEYGAKKGSASWRKTWNLAFGLGSALPALLFGVALGNILRGLPLDAGAHFTGNFLTLLNPYALLCGLICFFMMALHGALFAALKTEGKLHEKAMGWARFSWLTYLVLLLVGFFVTFFTQPHLMANFKSHPVLWLLPIVTLAALVAAKALLSKQKTGAAFTASSASIVALTATLWAWLFPYLVPALHEGGKKLSIYDASSSKLTLTVMLILAAIGVPIVLAYTIWSYHVFRGKTAPGEGY